MNTKPMKRLLCAAMGGAILFGACAPGARPAPVEPDLRLAAELEQVLLQPRTETVSASAAAAWLDSAPLDLESALQTVAEEGLSIPTTFAITRPNDKLTTSYSSYFITGTSDPTSPVYYAGEAIERLGTSGVFGVLVELEMGANTFSFSQGDRSQTVTIVRTAEASGISPIQEIEQSSAVPAIMTGVRAGDKLSVGCIAPAGATVTATYDGKTITLEQTKTDTAAGMPATFTGKIGIDAGGYDPDTTVKGEAVAYTMNWNGATKSCLSDGLVYVAGADSRIAVEVDGTVGFVYPDTDNLANFKEIVKAGARDYVAEETNEYFALSSGGFIHKGQVKILTGQVRVQNKLERVHFSRTTSGETITFSGTRNPMYNTWIEGDVFYLRFYNTSDTPKVNVGDSRIATAASTTENTEESRVTYKFPVSGLIWGYDVRFDGNDTVLTWKYKPALGGDSAPLRGVTVLLDPGHGGTDPGALGLAGETGPTEAAVNYANAMATRDELEARGAKVILTRAGDDYVTLDERLQMIVDRDVDLFVSMHHNSIAENADANQVSGVEVYYHTALSRKTSDHLMARLSADLGRANRSVTQSYYRVTLLPYAPSMLLELGYMSHPLDYENAVDTAEMKNVATAIADGIIQALR